MLHYFPEGAADCAGCHAGAVIHRAPPRETIQKEWTLVLVEVGSDIDAFDAVAVDIAVVREAYLFEAVDFLVDL
jgi:hypothetical protein